MNANYTTIVAAQRQQGAALIVGLLLLVIITVLAVSGMNTATTELAMARNEQSYESAFQAAETGLDLALTQGGFNTISNPTINTTTPTNETVTATIQFQETTLVPDRAFSLGVGSGVAAYHFVATSQGELRQAGAGTTSARDATATHTQAFYIVGPESPAL